MNLRWFAASCALLVCMGLAGCAPRVSKPALLLDEQIALTRQAGADSAARSVQVHGAATLVAYVDENLTDVRVRISSSGAGAASRTVEVENRLGGSGIEIATLDVDAGSQATITVSGPPNSNRPGSIHFRLSEFPPGDARAVAYQAWSAATQASFHADEIKRTGLDRMQAAIGTLESVNGDAPLAAQARLLRANLFYFFAIDPHAANAEAQRAGQAFAALPRPDALGRARAQLIEAEALTEIAQDRASQNPSAEEARQLAHSLLDSLTADGSPFSAIERARAFAALAFLQQRANLYDDADALYARAQALYQSAGYTAGVIEMRAMLARILVERGRFHDAAQAFDEIFPALDVIPNPAKRVNAQTAAARAFESSGRTDEATALLLKAIDVAAANRLREQEGSASQEIGFVYWYRGDYAQAKAFLARALQIAREDHDPLGLSFTLQSSGMIARFDGDYAAAIRMHLEAAQVAPNPIARTRALRHLALDYAAVGRHAEAIATLRESLAVKLQDPRHFALNDGKRDLAEQLIEHGDGSRATLAEADALLQDAFKQCVALHDVLREIGSRRVMARLLVKRGEYAAAEAEYNRTFALIFEYRATIANAQLRQGTIIEEQPAFRGFFDLMMRDVLKGAGSVPRRAAVREAAALRMLGRARETHFNAVSAGPFDAATTARIDALLAQMADKSLSIAALLGRSPTPEDARQLATQQLDMSKLRAQLDIERTGAAQRADATPKNPGRTPRAWRVLPPGTVQLSYALGNDHAYVWARTQGETRVAVLSESPELLEKELAELAAIDRQQQPKQVEGALEDLSAVLLPPGVLPRDSHALEIVAEGRIAGVPFSGLRSSLEPRHPLIETHSITLVTSMFASTLPRTTPHPRPYRLVALASGGGALRSAPLIESAPRLQAAVAEIDVVSQLFKASEPESHIKLLTRGDGSVEALRNIWSSGADVVHFATHALADLRQPLASLLVLPASAADGSPTYLTAGQVESWRGDTELVFLNACDSAIGPPRFAGGMPGLQSAFLRAGAHGVIATLWPVEDVLAREFAVDFYARYARGESAVDALGATQRAWLAPRAGESGDQQRRRRLAAMAHAYFAI